MFRILDWLTPTFGGFHPLIIGGVSSGFRFLRMSRAVWPSGSSLTARVRVGTVHTSQGGEAGLVVFDPVNTAHRWLRGAFDDAEPMERLVNVACSRARRQLVLLGSRDQQRKVAPLWQVGVVRACVDGTSVIESSTDAKGERLLTDGRPVSDGFSRRVAGSVDWKCSTSHRRPEDRMCFVWAWPAE